MGIKYIGERISPHSKFSVQYGIVYENNVQIRNSEKIKKVLAKYKHAVENNWIVTIDIIFGDKNKEKLEKSGLVKRMYIHDRHIAHYLSKPVLFSYYGIDNSKNHLPPFYIGFYREFIAKFSKRQATKIKSLFLKKGIKNIFITEYYSGLTGKHLGYEIAISNTIEHRFSLMDFE